jgi:2-dehydro-3-deoxygluconokinase
VEGGRYQSVCEELVRRFPGLKTVAITLRGSLSASRNSWSAVLWHGGRLLAAPVYDILPVIDRVGSGDAFNGGLIYGLRRPGADPEYALRFATAASCLKHSIPGDFNVVTVAEVEQLMAGDASGRVSR